MNRRFLSNALPLVVAAALLPTAVADAAPPARATSILFIGNSFTYAALSPVHYFRAGTVADLNGEGIGGVPALFKAFTAEAGLDYAVNLETSPGKGLDWHLQNKASIIGRPWDVVVMHGFSTLDAAHPGDPALLIRSARDVAALLRAHNPRVEIHLMATWTRADQTYLPSGHWYGKPVGTMAKDVRAGYDRAAAGAPGVKDVIPVGQAWDRAINEGVADANPYDGIDAGKVDLWAYDNYHASTYGYYLEALMDFGDVTGLDPRSLGGGERCADMLGVSPAQAAALERVAAEELTAAGRPLRPFTPHPDAVRLSPAI